MDIEPKEGTRAELYGLVEKARELIDTDEVAGMGFVALLKSGPVFCECAALDENPLARGYIETLVKKGAV